MIFSAGIKHLFKLCTAVLLFCGIALCAGPYDDLSKLKEEDLDRLRADNWQVVGNNVVVSGNVYMPIGKKTEVFADKVIINTSSRDFEAIGNVRVFRWTDMSGPATLDRIAELQKSSNTLVHSVTGSADALGNRSYMVKASVQTDNITADRAAGNLDSGYLRFDKFTMSFGMMTCRAENAEYLPDGVLILKNGEVSSCNYLESNNAHYSIAAGEIKLLPYEQRFYGIEHADRDQGDRTILLTNGVAKIYGVPVLWLPWFWRPKDENPGLFNFRWGRESDWGFYARAYKYFTFSQYPLLQVRLMTDFYEKRGFGYGVSGKAVTEESNTEFFAYALYDRHRFEKDNYDNYRLNVPKYRYNFRISNVSHITPGLDFRGVLEHSSDPYFRRDFFTSRYNNDPQPATFWALEQQFDRFSAAVYMRLQTNDFYTTVERFPEVRLDLPRQEILNTGIYYQGDMSSTYLRMKWVDFDSYPAGYSRLSDYDAYRFDTTHFLYYPVATRFFNLVPRAGFRFTAYSRSSEREVSDQDLATMFSAALPRSNGRYRFTNYDGDGGAKARIAAELGAELSTKIHNTWQDARNTFMEIDGVRHIMQPYVNYTFISKPTVDKENLYYFDDIDRLDEQNFFRFGLINRLQTRSGNGLRDFFYMENFWDLHLQKKDGMSQLGNLGTLMQWKIFKGLSLHTRFLMDISGDGEIADTYRNGRNAGKTGLALKWLNQWNFGITYSPAPDWKFSFSYNYLRPYNSIGAYSMGSTLTQINATSSFMRRYTEINEFFSFGVDLPITPDRRTLGFFRLNYDVEMGSIDTATLTVLRKFHCWQLIAAIGVERDYDEQDWDFNFSVQANLTGLNSTMGGVQNTVLQGLGETGFTSLKF